MKSIVWKLCAGSCVINIQYNIYYEFACIKYELFRVATIIK